MRERVVRAVRDRQLERGAGRVELAVHVERAAQELRQRGAMLRQPAAEVFEPRERRLDLTALELRARERARDGRVVRMLRELGGELRQVGVRRHPLGGVRRHPLRGGRHGAEQEAQ